MQPWTTPPHKGVTVQFGGGPLPDDWYGTLDAICAGRLDPLPALGEIIGLDDVPAALDRARRSDGPPRTGMALERAARPRRCPCTRRGAS